MDARGLSDVERQKPDRGRSGGDEGGPVQLHGSRASPPTGNLASVSALRVGARILESRLAARPEQIDRQRLRALVERALPWIEAEEVPLAVGLVLLERLVLALLDEDEVVGAAVAPRHLRLVPQT